MVSTYHGSDMTISRQNQEQGSEASKQTSKWCADQQPWPDGNKTPATQGLGWRRCPGVQTCAKSAGQEHAGTTSQPRPWVAGNKTPSMGAYYLRSTEQGGRRPHSERRGNAIEQPWQR